MMKETRPCVSSGEGGWGPCQGSLLGGHTGPASCPPVSVPGTGSLWEPNITLDLLEASQQLQASFTPWNESARYQILLESFPRDDNQTCFQHTVDMPAVTLPPTPPNTTQSHLSAPHWFSESCVCQEPGT